MLRMSVVNNLVYYFIDQHEIFPNTLFVEHATVISEHLHHSVQDVKHTGRLHVVFRSGDEVDTKLLCKEVIDAFDIL